MREKIKMSLRNRIAFYFMSVTAVFTAVLFFLIYYIVHNTVYSHLNSDLETEYAEVSNSIVFVNGEMIFANNLEWKEKEHGQAEVNPTFIQVVDAEGKNIRKTVNLLSDNLVFHPGINAKEYFDLKVGGSAVRQLQAPLATEEGKIKAYLLIAIPLEESALVLLNLKTVLLISYPVMLLLLFSVSRLFAGRIVSPVNNIIATAEHITRENLNERIPSAPRKDELYKLTTTINKLLDRLQDAVLREKQFTADASHELRTPISVIRGTLEVLIRKEREPAQYAEKIKYVIGEIDRMSDLIEQLLSLARYESGKVEPMMGPQDLKPLVSKICTRFQDSFDEKGITLEFDFADQGLVKADAAMLEIILENLLSNAVKYTPQNGRVSISTNSENGVPVFSIRNTGEVISPEHLHNIFDRFYRADQSRNSEIDGNGLGLAIVKRLTDLQGFSIIASSDPENGTSFVIKFNS